MFEIGLLALSIFSQNVDGYIDILIKNPNDRDVVEKITSLGKTAIPIIEKKLPDVPLATQRSLVRILGAIKDTSATYIILRFTKSESPLMRADAAHALGELQDRRAGPRLAELLSDVHDSPRGEAAWALGEIGDTSVIPALVSLTNDPVFTNRAKALVALGKLKGLSKVTHLEKFLVDPDPSVRISLALAIGRTNDPGYFHYLEKLTRDAEVFVRIQTFKVLGRFNSESARSLLVAGLSDPHEGVRMQILESLIGLRDPGLMPYVVRLRNDPSKAVRKRVSDLMKKLDHQFLIVGMTEVVGTADLPLDLRRGALIYLMKNLEEEELIRNLLTAFPFWTRNDALNVVRRRVVEGMTKDQVSLAIGEPSQTKKDSVKHFEEWFYDKPEQKIIFLNGRVIK